MPPAAANANQQVGVLQRFIAARAADGKVTATEANQILSKAKEGGVQGGELGLLRALASRDVFGPITRDRFVKSVDQVVPDGAPTAKMAAILFRLDPATGRRQLIDLLTTSKSPVAGGPKTFVIRDAGRPYIAAITTGQVISGLVKYLKGASPVESRQLRSLLSEQLKVLRLPISRGGLRVPGLTGDRGLALAAQTAQGPFIAINQSAIVLKELEKVAKLSGPDNAHLAAQARDAADKVATELKADLAHAYPQHGPFSYGLVVRSGRAINDQLEDGRHLQTTYEALKGLDLYRGKFAANVRQLEARYPELKFVGPEDLDGRSGHTFTPDFDRFRSAALQAGFDNVVNRAEAQRMLTLAGADGLRSVGEKALLRRAAQQATPGAKPLLVG